MNMMRQEQKIRRWEVLLVDLIIVVAIAVGDYALGHLVGERHGIKTERENVQQRIRAAVQEERMTWVNHEYRACMDPEAPAQAKKSVKNFVRRIK